MLKRFLGYYKPHLRLFILDMSVALFASLLSIFFPFVTRILLKTALPDRDTTLIGIILGIILAIYVMTSFLSYIRIKWGHILGVRIEYDLRSDIFRHLQKLSFTYFDNVKTGHIMSRISNDLNTITEVAHHAPEDLLISLCVLTGAFILMFQFNAQLALIAMLPVPVMGFWGIVVGRKMKDGFRGVRKKIADINSSVENSVQGIREVKSYANEELEFQKFEVANVSFRQAKEHVYGIMGVFYSVMHFLRDLYYLTIITFGTVFIYTGKMDVPDLVGFLLFVGVILPPIERLINFTEQYYQGVTSFERFVEVMDIEPDIKDKKDAYSLKVVSGEIEMKDVSFAYESSDQPVLERISLHVPAGKSIAVVGESGAGKSTLVSLLPRFYESRQGNILFDGHDIMGLTQRFLRENIGIVQQSVFLFDSSIRDNILYGKPDAGEADVINAAKQANIYDHIMGLDDGFDTLVGERGVKLSGGQQQRVSIARVFLKNPPVLIFDEATSSLDTESEHLIQESMKTLSRNRTTIIIAHRLSTVKHVDCIYVMKNGCIVETGSHADLVAEDGYYCSLYEKNLF
ncbi:MAG: ABC transporter ATP-binding protein [Desulfobacteraceae bacterium]|nr:ABC transporter ATP-binding protein [Desulfobacteraceae bacterium]